MGALLGALRAPAGTVHTLAARLTEAAPSRSEQSDLAARSRSPRCARPTSSAALTHGAVATMARRPALATTTGTECGPSNACCSGGVRRATAAA